MIMFVRDSQVVDLLCDVVGPEWSRTLAVRDGYAGWILVMGYVVAVACCLHAWRRDAAASARESSQERRVSAPWFWLVTAALLALCAVSKPLDLHVFITDIGRRIARAGGWYDDRRRVQAVLAVAAGAASFLALLIIGWRVRRSLGRYGIALAGLWLVALYAGLRVVSLHAVDAWLETRLRGVRLHGIVEAFALVLIAAGAVVSGRAKRPPA
jgi:hypothetical protein